MSVRAGYLPQLDALRAFSVIAVVYQHYGNPAINGSVRPGILGVRLFFVISGFLITGILLRSRQQVERGTATRFGVLKVFYIRRFFRIFPAYYFVLFGAALLALPTVRETFFWHLFYLSNYYYAGLGAWEGPVSHFWSLAVEEQFYLVWPFLILLTPRRWLPGLLVATVAVGPLARFYLITATSNVVTMSTPLPSCVDSLALGAILAWIREEVPASKGRWHRVPQVAMYAGFLATALLLALKFMDSGWRLRMALTDFAAGLIFIGLIDRVADGYRGVVGRILEAKPIVYVGTISYGVYLYHNFVSTLAQRSAAAGVPTGLPETPGTLAFAYALAVTLLMATASWYLIERPLNGLKERFTYSAMPQARHKPPAGVAAADRS